MKVKSKIIGEVEISEENIIYFPKGILGFKESDKFIVINMDEGLSCKILQDISNEYISFLIVNPWDYYSDYSLNIDDRDLESIEVTSMEELVVYNIVTLKENIKDSTCNLLAPIIINVDKNLGKQIILDGYNTREKLNFI